MNQQIFFILGCQRSGTTLMRLILDSHSKIHCYDESKSYQILRTHGNQFPDDIKNKKDLIGFKVLGYAEQMTYPVLMEPVNNTKIPNLYSSEKLIFMYRDVRDVIASMRNYIQKNGLSWLDNWIMPTINFWQANIPEFEKKFNGDLKFAKQSKNKIISFAAIYWKFKTQSMLNYEQKNFKMLKIKYEDLVSHPDLTIKKITDFLAIPWERSLLNHHLITHSEVDKIGLTVGMNDSKKAIHENSIGSYEKFLSYDEQKDILKITKPLLNILTYV